MNEIWFISKHKVYKSDDLITCLKINLLMFLSLQLEVFKPWGNFKLIHIGLLFIVIHLDHMC